MKGIMPETKKERARRRHKEMRGFYPPSDRALDSFMNTHTIDYSGCSNIPATSEASHDPVTTSQDYSMGSSSDDSSGGSCGGGGE